MEKTLTMKHLLTAFFIASTSLVFFNSCSKDEKKGNSTLNVRLTDNPFNAEEINVDIREVRVNFADDSSGWRTLTSSPGVYNLLTYQNGRDTLIATGSFPYGTVKEIRFILGSNNSIKISNVLYPLTIPSGGESGLKIKVNKGLQTPNEVMIIDFDAALSVIQTGNGEYKLKPVIKLK
jgi:hypothetical protein